MSKVSSGYLMAAVAWEICASVHRDFCKGADPFYSTRQEDFVEHAAKAREKALEVEQEIEQGIAKYRNDPKYNRLVTMLENFIKDGVFTPYELESACVLASTIIEPSHEETRTQET